MTIVLPNKRVYLNNNTRAQGQFNLSRGDVRGNKAFIWRKINLVTCEPENEFRQKTQK